MKDQLQNHILRLIDNSFQKNRLSHAYLFIGEKGSNKLLTAQYFAAKMYCINVCLTCPTCLKIFNNKHLNVYYLEPDGQNIKKEQIENLQKEFSKTSLENGKRIFIINHADKMNASAFNSLLKFLEEPNDNIYGFLLTENETTILPTIKSRCQIVYFHKTSIQTLETQFIEAGIEEHYAKLLPLFCNNLLLAQTLMNNGFANLVQKATKTIALIDDYDNFLKFIKDDPIDTKDDLQIYLDLLLINLKALLLKTNNKDYLQYLIKEIQDMQKRLYFNVNLKLQFDQLLIKWKQGE